jgi:hypothetical protein
MGDQMNKNKHSFASVSKEANHSDSGHFIANIWKLKNEGNLHASDHYLASHAFQMDLLEGLTRKIFNAINDYARKYCISYRDDSCITFSTDGFPQYQMIALSIAGMDSKSSDYFFKFNSAGSFIVGSPKHPLNIHPFVSAAYQVCVERRCGYIRDSDLISEVLSDPDILATIKERKG